MNRDMLYDLCNKLGKGTKTKGYLNIDRRKASPVYITRIIENANDINALCQALWDIDFNLAKIERTPSGAIKKHNIHTDADHRQTDCKYQSHFLCDCRKNIIRL